MVEAALDFLSREGEVETGRIGASRGPAGGRRRAICPRGILQVTAERMSRAASDRMAEGDDEQRDKLGRVL